MRSVLTAPGSIVILILVLFLAPVAFLLISSRPYDLCGPPSPSGHRVVVHVSDCGYGWGADFYADVEVLNSNGEALVRWRDRSGQDTRDGPQLLVKSMKWLDHSTLEFRTRHDRIVLKIAE